MKKQSYLTIPYRILSVLTLTLLIVSGSYAQKELTILYTNDIESVYEPVDAFWNDTISSIGGIPYLATLINETRDKEDICFLFDAGDIFTGALSAASEGALPFDIYSSMGYDAMSLGNHEFEYDWDRLVYVQQRATFPVLCCNIFYEGTDINFCRSYAILEKQGVRIGVIGLMGEEAFINTMNPTHRTGLEARNPLPIAQKLVDEIRNEVDLVVLLTHQNMSAPMQTDKEADPYVWRGFDEDYAMAGAIKNVDLIIGGHSDHGLWEPVIHPETGTIVCLTFGQGKYLGYLNLTLEDEGILINEAKLIPVESDRLQPDEKVLELVAKVREENPELTEVLGTTEHPAYRKYYMESTLGNLFTDMLREFTGADIGLLNSGCLRADLNPGDITTETVINIYPFVDKYHVKEITGSALKELLEYSYQLTYGFAQLSGIHTTFDSSKPKGERLISATINGQPLEEKKYYTIATTAFIGNGGDGFSMLKNGKHVRESEDILVEYFKEYIRIKKTMVIPELGSQVDISGRE